MTIFVAKKITETPKNVKESEENTLFSQNTNYRFRETSRNFVFHFREILFTNFTKYESVSFNEISRNLAFAKFREHPTAAQCCRRLMVMPQPNNAAA